MKHTLLVITVLLISLNTIAQNTIDTIDKYPILRGDKPFDSFLSLKISYDTIKIQTDTIKVIDTYRVNYVIGVTKSGELKMYNAKYLIHKYKKVVKHNRYIAQYTWEYPQEPITFGHRWTVTTSDKRFTKELWGIVAFQRKGEAEFNPVELKFYKM